MQENSTQQLEMHIRIKRAKTVLFLYVDPSETIRDVKNKIEALLGQVSSRYEYNLNYLLPPPHSSHCFVVLCAASGKAATHEGRQGLGRGGKQISRLGHRVR